MQDRKASINSSREHLEISGHAVVCQPGQTEWGYAEEQRYESFDELYGPDAYMGDPFPYTLAGSLRTEIIPAPSIQPGARTGLKPEIVQEQAQAVLAVQEKTLKSTEEKAAKESGITPFREDAKS